MRRVLVTLLASLGVAGVLPGAASATVYCVPASGISPDCTPGQDFGDLSLALNAAVSNAGPDTVRIGAGTFPVALNTSSSGELTTIVGAGSGQTFLQGSGNTTIVALSGSFKLQDLTVRRTSGTSLPVANLQAVAVENVTFARTGGSGNVVDYNNDPVAGGPGLKNVKITAAAGGTNGDFGLNAFNASADGLIVEMTGPGDAVVGNSLVLKHANIRAVDPTAAVNLYGTSAMTDSLVVAVGSAAEGLWVGTNGATTSVKLRNSTIASADGISTRTGVRVFNFLPPGRTVTLDARSTAVLGFQTPWCAGTGSNATQAAAVTLNTAYTAASAAPIECPSGIDAYVNTAGSVVLTAGAGNVAAAPQVVNAALGNYAPLPGGNLIDAGDPAALDAFDTTTDLVGAARVLDGNGNGSAVRDIGAYEAAAVSPPGTPPTTPPSNPKVVSVTFKGKLKRASVTRKAALTVLPSAPTGSKPFFTVRLDSAPSTITLRLARRGASGKFSTLKSAVSFTASSTTLLLRPTGSWNRKRLARGTYRLSVSTPDGTAKSVTFKVK